METNKKNQLPVNQQTSYGHMELAMLYFPYIAPRSASRQLSRWIKNDPDLLEELTQYGYQSGRRLYSPKQTEILFHHLGKPN